MVFSDEPDPTSSENGLQTNIMISEGFANLPCYFLRDCTRKKHFPQQFQLKVICHPVWPKFQVVTMAPKRPSNGSSSGRAPKKGKTGEELADQVEKEKETIAGLPFWNLLMDDVDDMFQSFGTVTDFFMATYPTFAERKKLTEMLMTHFGSGENVLSSDFTPGIKSFALWQVCYHVEAGNKGLVINEYMKNLIKLVIIYGPKTDASCQAGVEYPVIQALVPSYFDSPWETECVDASAYQSQSVGFTKGWTRGLAFLYVAHMIIKHDLVDHYKKELPKAYANFCLLKGMVTADFASELDRINANRGTLPKISLNTSGSFLCAFQLAAKHCWKLSVCKFSLLFVFSKSW